MCSVDDEGNRTYTFKKEDEANNKPNISAHPARFSPDDKFSKQRVMHRTFIKLFSFSYKNNQKIKVLYAEKKIQHAFDPTTKGKLLDQRHPKNHVFKF